ncbi:precorrin-3B synthase [Paraburkholderia caballeronis]|uniref:Precorrin-3B synthase n=1 Tax=Paraburkholderia caballeronis TaxID=416943 RepID=A0A1H7NQJ4_9BURK|nr:precorrin-3B synthase [Paraburkholderia caballeronis]PXW25593.1 precorrin-3B synthase [Paraburkholderia caballeronis]PXX01200.1 precorrin-3B synthase [Paraburkholderia caballeronis]RAJ99447.1 precorrin-3B synthase [Paraburkholderia caballeronis]SEE30965.1 precorrin-3B synthase [Paraburkholderia caballeronis]SEL25325.1 precorrin-3B synthase [Paraburkholderia caballeronis]
MHTSNCPGLLHIVPALDGGICRIRLAGGVLDAAHALALAAAADRHAAGPIELTNRANLQVRGVRAGREADFSAELIAAGLGPGGRCDLDAQAAAALDGVRNVMTSPVAGRDPHASIDTRALAEQILDLLQNEPRFPRLSPKFALLLDGGERLAMLAHPHDIWLAAIADDAARDVRFAFGLAGCPPSNDDAHGNANTTPLGTVRPSQVPALVRALLHTFLDFASSFDGAQRMRDLLAAGHPAEAVWQRASASLDFAPEPAPAGWRRAAADPSLRFGAHRQRDAERWWIGAQPPLGRIDTATLRALADLARRATGSRSLHVTPWQGVLLPDVASRDVADTLASLARLGFACEANAPFARLIACSGSAGCARGLADTRADALALAARLPAKAEVHLSGCRRSCAAAHRAPYTLLAVAPGRYDLYRRNGGTTGFGDRVAHDASIALAAETLDKLVRSTPDV